MAPSRQYEDEGGGRGEKLGKEASDNKRIRKIKHLTHSRGFELGSLSSQKSWNSSSNNSTGLPKKDMFPSSTPMSRLEFSSQMSRAMSQNKEGGGARGGESNVDDNNELKIYLDAVRDSEWDQTPKYTSVNLATPVTSSVSATLSRLRGNNIRMKKDGAEVTEFSNVEATLSSVHSPTNVDSPKAKVARIRASPHIEEQMRHSSEEKKKRKKKSRRKSLMEESEGTMVFNSGNDLGESEIVI